MDLRAMLNPEDDRGAKRPLSNSSNQDASWNTVPSEPKKQRQSFSNPDVDTPSPPNSENLGRSNVRHTPDQASRPLGPITNGSRGLSESHADTSGSSVDRPPERSNGRHAPLQASHIPKRIIPKASALRHPAPGSVAEESKKKLDCMRHISNVIDSSYLPGLLDGTVPIYDSCDEVRRKIAEYSAKHKEKGDRGNFYEILRHQQSPPHSKPLDYSHLGHFRDLQGAIQGNRSVVYYCAYVWFEKLRIFYEEEKSGHRLEMERYWPNGLPTDVVDPQRRFRHLSLEVNEYGLVKDPSGNRPEWKNLSTWG